MTVLSPALSADSFCVPFPLVLLVQNTCTCLGLSLSYKRCRCPFHWTECKELRSLERIDFRNYKGDVLKAVSQTSVNLPDPEVLADKARGESTCAAVGSVTVPAACCGESVTQVCDGSEVRMGPHQGV